MSGWGYGAGPSRCFAYWQEFSKCYAQTDTPKGCVLQSEDYLECLHGIKRARRDTEILKEYHRKVEKAAKEGTELPEVLRGAPIVVQKDK